MDIEEFAEKFIKAEEEAFQHGNCDALAELEDPNVVYHMGSRGDLVGHEAHKQDLLAAQQAFSDIKQEWKYLTGEGNLLALSLKARYISTGNVPGLPAAGKEITEDAIFLLRLKNDRIVEAWANGSFTGLE